MKWIAIVVALAACSDLEPIDMGVCGNGVIDRDEDCDSSADHCVQCALKCAAVEPACPAGYICHTDGFCYAPGGVFPSDPTATAAFSAGVIDYAVSDVNKDHAGDLVGVTATSLAVKLGGDAMFTTQYEALTPFGSGDPAFADFDEDGALDVLLPTRDGLAGYTSRYKALAPHAFAFNPGGGENDMDVHAPAAVFSVDPRIIVVLSARISGSGLAVEIIDVMAGNTAPMTDEVETCSNIVVGTGGLRYDTYVVGSTPTSVNVMIAVRDVPEVGTAHLCVFQLDVNLATATTFTVDDPPTLMVDTAAVTRPVLLDLDDDGSVCPSLVVGPGAHLRPTPTNPCGFLAAPSPLPTPTPTPPATPVGRARLPHTAGFAPDAFVTNAGIVRIKSDRTRAVPIFGFDRDIDRVATGDIDKDGKLDVVVTSHTSNGVDILFGTNIPLPAPDQTENTLVLYRIASGGPITNVVTGDFDGNTVDDIVYTERDAIGERLFVAYGTRDRPLPPVDTGRFLNILSFLHANIPDSLDPARIISDLAVLHAPAPGDMFLTLLHGSPQRMLVSYFDPRLQRGSMFVNVVAGQFDPTTLPIDAMVLDWRSGATANGKTTLYVNPGVGDGKLNSSTMPQPGQMPIPFWYDLGNAGSGDLCTNESIFCLDRARFVTIPGVGSDRVIGVDRSKSPTAVLIDRERLVPTWPNMPGAVQNELEHATGLEIGAGDIRSLRAADIDGDGSVDVLASYTPSEVRICLRDDFASCSRLNDIVPELATAACGDVAPARVQPRGHFDPQLPFEQPTPFVALCDADGKRTVFRVVHDSTGFHADPLFDVRTTVQRIQIGDVSGDGIDDILVLDASGTFPHIHAFVQCSSRDVACRGAK